jgi:hypothetical protein
MTTTANGLHFDLLATQTIDVFNFYIAVHSKIYTGTSLIRNTAMDVDEQNQPKAQL